MKRGPAHQGWAAALQCCPPGNENHIISGRGCLDVRGGQVGIVAGIKVRGSVFDLGDGELLDRIEADGAEPGSRMRGCGDERLGGDLRLILVQASKSTSMILRASSEAKPPTERLPPRRTSAMTKCPAAMANQVHSSVADETAAAGYQDGMSSGGHIGNILYRLPQQGSFAPPVHQQRNAGHWPRSSWKASPNSACHFRLTDLPS